MGAFKKFGTCQFKIFAKSLAYELGKCLRVGEMFDENELSIH